MQKTENRFTIALTSEEIDLFYSYKQEIEDQCRIAISLSEVARAIVMDFLLTKIYPPNEGYTQPIWLREGIVVPTGRVRQIEKPQIQSKAKKRRAGGSKRNRLESVGGIEEPQPPQKEDTGELETDTDTDTAPPKEADPPLAGTVLELENVSPQALPAE